MSETAQKLLESETPEWRGVLIANWKESRENNPDLSLEESIRIDIKLRSILK